MGQGRRLRIERMTHEGAGIAREEGKVLFVAHAAPGDEVETAIERGRKEYAFSRIHRILKPGPGRVEPKCPHHFRLDAPEGTLACGGCGWQHLRLETQLEAKREIVRDCMFRIAKLREPHVEPTLASPHAWRYRNKVVVPLGVTGGDTVVAGFYAAGTHSIVPFDDCAVQPELSVALTRAVRDFARRRGWKIYDRRRDNGWLRHIFVRINFDGRALLTLVTRNRGLPDRGGFLGAIRREFPQVAGIFQNIQPKNTTVVLGPHWEHLWGEEALEEKLGPLRLRVSPASFLQVNTPACEVLYGVIRDFLTSGGFRPSAALDLYSGIGSIALWIAPFTDKVLGMESNRTAVRNAEENAALNGIRNVRFHAGEVESQVRRIEKFLEGEREGSAAAVIDPPRAGCTKKVLKSLRDPALGRLVYVSCNPATFARDADWLNRNHWRLQRVQPVDLFPQTSHVEIAGLFERRIRPTK